jgi:NAD(P)-dependent dehydrogenase (short-subunit alcohol dehydrogenase family)
MGDGRVALVTGANSGIGLATTLELARRGYVTVGTVRSEEKADVLAKAAAEAGVPVNTILLDVTDADRCREVIEQVEPWAVINNAGYGLTAAVEDVTEQEARALFDTMVFAPIRLARLALPHMRAHKGGRIVNISSIYGVVSTPLSGWYQGAKQALEGLSDALRVEVASDGIKVILIEPGGFKTGIWEDVTETRAGSRYTTAYERTQRGVHLSNPIMGNPDRVAKVIARALTNPLPRTRYLVGYDAQALALVERFVPTVVQDAVERLTLGL